MADENIYHKLLGLPEKLIDPTYFEMLELAEGDVLGPDVEEKYKRQIQKVQKFTNNPKYKEGALFLKGELRKARSALVDEARRAAYMRELLTKRTTHIRGVVKPLIVKGYLVDVEYQYLVSQAKKASVPEPVVQQVLKQELEKKGIDPTTAMMEGDGSAVARSKSVISPQQQRRKGPRGPMSLTARFPFLRYILDPSELFSVETAKAIATFPLWLLGIKKTPPRPGQPVAGGLVFHAPFVAACLLFLGIGALTIPYGEADMLAYKADRDMLQMDKEAMEGQLEDYAQKIAKLERRLKRAGDGGGSAAADPEEISKLKAQIQTLTVERDSARGERDKAIASKESAVAKWRDKYIKLLEGGGGSGAGSGDNPQVATLKAEIKSLGERLSKAEKSEREARADRDKAMKSNADLRKQADEATKKRQAAERALVVKQFAMLNVMPSRRLKLTDDKSLLVGRVTGGGMGSKIGYTDLTHEQVKTGDPLYCVRVIYIGELEISKVHPKKTTAWKATKLGPDVKILRNDIVWRMVPRQK